MGELTRTAMTTAPKRRSRRFDEDDLGRMLVKNGTLKASDIRRQGLRFALYEKLFSISISRLRALTRRRRRTPKVNGKTSRHRR
jgi:hypothetical protein